MAVNNSINTNNKALTIISGTGAINIGTDSTDKTITLGNQTGNTSLALSAGTSTTGTFNLGNDSIDKSITIGGTTGTSAYSTTWGGSGTFTIGTDAVDHSVTVGNTTGASALTLLCSSNSNIGTAAVAQTITIGNQTGATTLNINAKNPTFGSSSAAQTITIGGTTGVSALVLKAPTTLSSPTGGITYANLSTASTSVTLKSGIYYIATASSLQTFTLPSTAAIGTLIKLTGFGSGKWKIAQGTGQQINSTASSTTSGTGGSLAAGGRYDCVDLVCTAADTTWSVFSSTGTLTFT